jgi:hypothetical protein
VCLTRPETGRKDTTVGKQASSIYPPGSYFCFWPGHSMCTPFNAAIFKLPLTNLLHPCQAAHVDVAFYVRWCSPDGPKTGARPGPGPGRLFTGRNYPRKRAGLAGGCPAALGRCISDPPYLRAAHSARTEMPRAVQWLARGAIMMVESPGRYESYDPYEPNVRLRVRVGPQSDVRRYHCLPEWLPSSGSRRAPNSAGS